MRFNQYILEGRGRTKPISEEKAIEYIESNCSDALKMLRDGDPIYRSSETWTGDVGIVDPSKFNRKSRYTQNYYTLMLDNMPEWSKYPKRSKSLIGASSIHRAAEHVGTTYVMFPRNGTDIGVCPYDDLWDSFSIDLSYFNDLFGSMFQFFDMIPSDSWNGLRKQMDLFDEKYKEDADRASDMINQFIRDYYDGNLYDSLRKFFNPEKNGFKLLKIGRVLPQDKEIWWSGESIMVKARSLLIDKLTG